MVSEAAATTAAGTAAARRFVVLINRRAGTVLEAGEAVLVRRIADAFAACGAAAEVRAVDPGTLMEAVTALPDDAVPVIAGGDGTFTALLPTLMARATPCATLPIGTMNLLAHDLGFTGVIEDDVPALCAATVVRIDLARLGGRPFHSVSGLGFALAIATERERMRRRIPFSRPLAVIAAVLLAAVRSRSIEVTLADDTGTSVRRADAVVVTNNLFEGPPWRRRVLHDGTLEVLIIEAAGLVARVRLALAILAGRWRDLPGVEVHHTRRFVLRRGRRTRVTVDGEIVRVPEELDYDVLPSALAVLRAAPAEPTPA